MDDKRRLKFATQPKFLDTVERRKAEDKAGAAGTGSTGESTKNGSDGSDDGPNHDPSALKSSQYSSEAPISTDTGPPAPQEKSPDEEANKKPEDGGYRENPMSDEHRACINVWMESEDDGKQDDEETATEDYQTVFKAASARFDVYRHHHFDGEWKVYSEEKSHDKQDEEWFIPSPMVREDGDPEYLCEMCRQIDFGVLLTQRGLPGNNEPGASVIDLRALPRVLDESSCSFCTLVRQGLQGRCTLEEMKAAKETTKDGRMKLTVLDDGPDYALRLEVALTDLVPRLVVQMLAPEKAALPLQGLPVHQDIADMERLRSWVQTCEEHHPNEATPAEPSNWRFLDVEESRVVPIATPRRYACLSYVWGNEKGTQLTTQTMPILESPGGLNDSSISLGQTLRDAIKVTKDIGIRYLWVDALCIIQDDAADKERCISRMSDIYGNATITVIASTNSRPAEGLPGVGKTPRSRAQVVKKLQGITLAAAFHDARLPDGDIEDSVWNSRAWTFQERQLSQRAVYFTSSQMHFTCPHEVVFEDTVSGLWASRRPAKVVDRSKFLERVQSLMYYIWQDPTQTKFSNKTFHIHGLGSESVTMMGSDVSVPAPIYRATAVPTHGSGSGTLRIEGETMWKVYSDAVSMYTRRRMSWQTDALNAFQGVSNLVARGVNTSFWYGLPEFNFDQALLWYPNEPLTRRTYPDAAPSWSWAGWEGHTAYRGRGWHNAVALPPATVVRWFQFEHPRDLIYNYLVSGEHHTPEEVADFCFRTARAQARLIPIKTGTLFHLDTADDGWAHCRDTERNEHYFTHAAYSGLRFTYPATLPSQKPIRRAATDGAIFFVARSVPARFVDMSSTPHNPAPRVDPFLQIGIKETTTSRPTRLRPWDHIIYHQGYRAGILSLNVPFSSLDTTTSGGDAHGRYYIVPISRDTVPGIAPPAVGWDAYWGLSPRGAQGLVWGWEWGDEDQRAPVLGPHEDADEPYRGGVFENGDPYWDQSRFGNPFVLDVYNVLLLERQGGGGMEGWTRVGVGKMNSFAFWHAKPDDEGDMIVLR
ncbi:heterokaryon incompatibility protein-domain-containing protein [Lasiosphaeria hispida]|uniref:Heterokaryon incompatibility protein-domain-containing protein n=1 Tax=Lasiosphaeria hispida TaxID=260671 RepID=A0AAJ0HCJ7_9PEZI|nr:heterokaryon incompatibility protein-domain-containing protein [Lasiosphaeria hispida]